MWTISELPEAGMYYVNEYAIVLSGAVVGSRNVVLGNRLGASLIPSPPPCMYGDEALQYSSYI